VIVDPRRVDGRPPPTALFDEQFAEANRRVREAMAHARPGDTVNITID